MLSEKDKPEWAQWFKQAIDLIFPPMCASCGRVGTALCEDCQSDIQWFRYTTPPISELDSFVALGPHDGVLRNIIHALKYESNQVVGQLLGNWLGQAIYDEQISFDTIVPVPLHSNRYRERGYNQAKLIADGLAPITGGDVTPNLLKRNRYTQSQVELSAEGRRQNVADAFSVTASAEQLPIQEVLLIDDVCTTGATLQACARTLHHAGIQHVSAAVVCYAVGH